MNKVLLKSALVLATVLLVPILTYAQNSTSTTATSSWSLILPSSTSTIAVMVPDGGESLILGGEQLVTWRTSYTFNYSKPTSFDVFVDTYTSCTSKKCPTSSYEVVKGLKNITSYKWIVGETNVKEKIGPGWYRVRICSYSATDKRVCDVSNGLFNISTSTTSFAPSCPVGYRCIPGESKTPQIAGCPPGFVCTFITDHFKTLYAWATSSVAKTIKTVSTPTSASQVYSPVVSSNADTVNSSAQNTQYIDNAYYEPYTPPLQNSGSSDSTAPSIIYVSYADVSPGVVKITWETGELATGRVEYGPTTSYGERTDLKTTLTKVHSFTVSDLIPGTRYYYRVISRDKAGNVKTSPRYVLITMDRPAVVKPPTSSVTPTPTPSITETPTPSPTPTPSETVGAAPRSFSQTATIWNAALSFFGLK
jgi:hypothetical protein